MTTKKKMADHPQAEIMADFTCASVSRTNCEISVEMKYCAYVIFSKSSHSFTEKIKRIIDAVPVRLTSSWISYMITTLHK